MQQQASRHIIQWDPSAGSSTRFIHAQGNTISLYRWLPREAELNLVASQSFQTPNEPSHIKCLAWSPHTVYTGLVAACSTNGKMQLMRLEGSPPAEDTIPNTSIIQPVYHLPRVSRPCNALAFSILEPTHLAVAAEKLRAESGLQIYDVERAADRIFSRSAAEQRNDLRPFYQHAVGESVSAVTFLNGSPASLLIGAANRFIRFIDMRGPQSNTGTQQVLSKHFAGLCTDPFDDIQFASFGDDAIVRVWDRRSLTKGPALSFSELDAGNPSRKLVPLAGISYCPTRRGLFATLRLDDTRLRLWDILSQWDNPAVHTVSTPPNSRLPTWTSAAPTQGRNMPFQLTLTGSRISSSVEGLQTFCFATTVASSTAKAPHFLAVSKDGSLRIRPVLHPPHHYWSPSGNFVATDIDDLKMYSIRQHPDDVNLEPWNVETNEVPAGLFGSHLKGASSSSDDGRIGRLPRTAEPEAIEFPPHGPSSLTASRPSKPIRTFSPSAMRRYSIQNRSRSRTPQRSPNVSPRSKALFIPNRDEDRTSHSKDKLRDGLTPEAHISMEDKYVLFGSIEEDISFLMHKRTLAGYSLRSALHNAKICSENDDVLSKVWLTLARFVDVLRVNGTSRVLGYDFAYSGCQDIWEGIPSIRNQKTPDRNQDQNHDYRPSESLVTQSTDVPSFPTPPRSQHLSTSSHTRLDSSASSPKATADVSDFDLAVDAILDQRTAVAGTSIGINALGSLPLSIATSRLGRRRLALALWDWDIGKDQFLALIHRWESEGQVAKAACWASLLHDQNMASELLLRSEDDLLHVVAGTMAALQSQDRSPGNHSLQATPWRTNCLRMIQRLSDPYIRIMLSQAIEEPWTSLLKDERVALSDKVGMAFRFVTDDKLSNVLSDLRDSLLQRGSLEALFFTGLSEKGMDVLQAYNDCTGDVQTAAMFAAYVFPSRVQGVRPWHWIEAYHNLLDSWGLFHFRCQFDIDRGQVIQQLIQSGVVAPFEWVQRQLYIRCNYCGKVNSQKPLIDPAVGVSNTERVRATCCPTCGKTLPRCVVCLMAIGISDDHSRDIDTLNETFSRDNIDDAVVFCQTCQHGGHAAHIFEWFFGMNGQPHETCAVADCNCRCAEI